MNRCNINLGRDWILPVGTRRRICRTMTVYLTGSVLLLGLAVYEAGLNLRRAAEYRDAARAIRQQFSRIPEDDESLRDYAGRLTARIENCTQEAQAIHAALPADIHTVLPLLNFLISQKDGSRLIKMAFGSSSQDQDKNKGAQPSIEFSLALPVDGRKGSGSEAIQNWQKVPALTDIFSSITPVTTRSGDGKDANQFVVNYRAVFKE
jgi:hypothetical protein